MTRKPLTVVDVTKLDWTQLEGLWREGFDVAQEMASRPEAGGEAWTYDPACECVRCILARDVVGGDSFQPVLLSPDSRDVAWSPR